MGSRIFCRRSQSHLRLPAVSPVSIGRHDAGLFFGQIKAADTVTVGAHPACRRSERHASIDWRGLVDEVTAVFGVMAGGDLDTAGAGARCDANGRIALCMDFACLRDRDASPIAQDAFAGKGHRGREAG